MQFYLEQRDPQKDLGGLCECFVNEANGLHAVAKPHVHEYFELLYCLCGSYELRVQRQAFTLHVGDAALIHPMEPHQTRTLTDGRNSYLVLKFTPEALYSASHPIYELGCIFPYLRLGTQRSYVYTAAQLSGSGLGETLLRLLDERQRQEFGYEMALRAGVQQVLLFFIRAWRRQSDAVFIDERSLSRLQTVLDFVEAHLDEPLSAADAARACGMGLSTFSRFFSKAAGVSFPAYVCTQRLGRALCLLLQTDKSITDIAVETGFSSASYMIVCFRRQYQKTPAQMRALYQRA